MASRAQRRSKARENLPTSMREYIIDPDVVYGFTGSMLAPRFDNPVATPAVHLEFWELCGRADRRVAIAAPRDHAKSTAVTHAWALACALFMKKRNIMILSDTQDQAKQHLATIRAELADNDEVIKEFNIRGFLADSSEELVVSMGDGGYTFRFFAKGAGQSLRGSKWITLRPDLVICDDMENDEAVDNEDRRKKLKRWMQASLLPMLAKHGHIRMVGTILHWDSYLETRLNSEKWTSRRYEAHDDNFENLLWPEQYTPEYFRDKYDLAVEDGLEDVYYQEYRNIPIDPSKALIRAADLIEVTPEELMEPGFYYAAGDLAISKEQKADYTAFVVVKITNSGKVILVDIVRDRFDSVEIIDKIFEIQHDYQPEVFAIEQEKITQSIGPFLEIEMNKRDIYPNILKIPSVKDLVKRSWGIRARIRSGKFRYDPRMYYWDTAKSELIQFPRSTHDDITSALALIGKILDKQADAPTEDELEEERFADARYYDEDEDFFDDDEERYFGVDPYTGY